MAGRETDRLTENSVNHIIDFYFRRAPHPPPPSPHHFVVYQFYFILIAIGVASALVLLGQWSSCLPLGSPADECKTSARQWL